MVRLTATEVARSFSRVMSRVSAGEEIEIVRNGAPIAELRPARARPTVSTERWRNMIETAPPIDDDFARDVEQGRAAFGPPSGAWPS
ncbi:MAG TPA: type II toxin-antitoxin system prevent-host-death family antitoxin [Conexibacter sp.]|nr:type II toxin-antitoxin system prevent-host-death family antitoxin [Conexibacter sp.]